MRLIDADELQLAIVEEGQANKRKKYVIGDIWELTGAEIREVINSMPTIQPKRGRWIDGYCSECGAHAPFWAMASTYHKSNFCPNCGVNMRGEQE